MKTRTRRSMLIFAVAITTLLQPTMALAASNYDKKAVINDTIFYDPRDYTCTDAAGGFSGPLVGGDNMEKAFRYFVGKGLTPEQSAGIIGNLMRESNINPSSDNPAAGGGGGGIAQWEGGRWSSAGGLLAFATKAGKPWQDLGVQLDFLWAELNGTSPVGKQPGLNEIKSKNTPEDAAIVFEDSFERPRDNHHALSAGNARKAFDIATSKGWITATSGASTAPPAVSDCLRASPTGSGGGVVARATSDLAWPKPDCVQDAFGAHRGNCKVSTPRYAAEGGTHTNPGGNDAFTDCGTFVATVMRGGPDPNYPRVQTGTQRSYILAHRADKYDIIDRPSSTSQLQPGDILVHTGHTLIYLGGPGQTAQSSASWHNHTPHLSSVGGVQAMFSHGDTIAARLKAPVSGPAPQ